MFSNVRRCKECNGVSIHIYSRQESFRNQITEIKPFLLESVAKFSLLETVNSSCALERTQWQIIKYLVAAYSIDLSKDANVLIRFAALMGHAGLLHFVLRELGMLPERVKHTNDLANLLGLLKDALACTNVMVIHECLTTGLLRGISESEWDDVIGRGLRTHNVNIMSLLIDAGPKTTFAAAVETLKYATFAKSVFINRRNRFDFMSRFVVLNSDLAIYTNEQRIQLLFHATEFGDVVIARHLSSLGWDLNGENRSSVVNSLLYGHIVLLKFLLNEARINPSVFTIPNCILLVIAMINHSTLLYAIITGTISVIIGIYCSSHGQVGSFQMFGFTSSDRICYSNVYGTTSNGYMVTLIPLLIFLGFYLIYSRWLPLIPFLRGIYLVKQKIRQARVIGIEDLV